MKQPRSIKEKLGETLPLRAKLTLKRFVFGCLTFPARVAGIGRRLTERIGKSTAEECLELHVPEPVSTQDFSLIRDLSSKLAVRKGERHVNVSIIIPVINKIECTLQCLRALLHEIDLNDTEIIVVNNASTDETSQILSHFGDLIRAIDNEENQGFVDACNHGAAAAGEGGRGRRSGQQN